MKLLELVAHIEADERLVIHDSVLAEDIKDDALIVLCHESTRAFSIQVNKMTDAAWSDYIDMFLGKRYPDVMTWVSRVVGYFSFVKAQIQGTLWNRSKIAELADRQKGNYDVPDGKVIAINPDQLPITFSTSHIKPVSEAEWKRRLREKGIIKNVA